MLLEQGKTLANLEAAILEFDFVDFVFQSWPLMEVQGQIWLLKGLVLQTLPTSLLKHGKMLPK